MVHRRRQQVVGHRPVGGLAEQFPVDGALPREVLDQDLEPARGQFPAVPVQQVLAVVAEQVRFEGLGVFVDELGEAQPSPRPSPVSLP